MDARYLGLVYSTAALSDWDTMTLVFPDEIVIPAQAQVCPTCKGRGTHVNPDIDSCGISHEEFEADPDFYESYISGAYDVACYECKGRTTVLVPAPKTPEDVEFIRDYARELEEEAAYASMRERGIQF